MKEQYNFVGKNITPEVIIKSTQKIDHFKDDTNEVKKTEEEIQIIKNVEFALNKELSELGLPSDFSLDPNQVHINKSILEVVSNKGGEAHMLKQQIEIVRDPTTMFQNLASKIVLKLFNKNLNFKQTEFMRLIHESIHLKSHHKYELVENKRGEHKINPHYRVGVASVPNKRELPLFNGFNEGLVQKTTIDIINKWNNNTNFSKKEGILPAYTTQMEVVDRIVEKISKTNGETKENVLKRFKKSQFTGEMMHLRDVEKVFGPGALQILALMGTSESVITDKLFIKYFSTNNESVRKLIAKTILADNNVKKYIIKYLGLKNLRDELY